VKHNVDDGKLTVSLGLKDWLVIIGVVCAAAAYVTRLETANVARDKQGQVAKATADSALAKSAGHGWRLRRIEKKLKIQREVNR